MAGRTFKRYLTPQQILDEKILPYTSTKTIERMIKDEGLPCIRRGERGVLIDLDDLDAFLKRRKKYEAS
jgi:excisionase family DNA binding protein